MSTNRTMRNKINNIEDLLSEISRVDALREEQEAYLKNQYDLLKKKVEQPFRIAGRIFDFVPGVGLLKSATSAIRKSETGKADWLTRSLQLIMPLVLNRTVLRNAGWFKKVAVALASETAVSQVNKSSVSAAISGIANFIRPKNKKKAKVYAAQAPGQITAEEAVESNVYGIPKDSETY